METKRWLSVGTILGGVLVALLLLGLVFVMTRMLYPSPSTVLVPTSVMKVISAATPTSLVIPGQTPVPSATPTLDPSIYGGIGIGQYVQISGTGGDGLRLRTGAGTENPPLFLGFESEVFLVQDGPKEAGGMIWWLLVSPTDEARKGWASARYLALINR
jgi:hypothetical protein